MTGADVRNARAQLGGYYGLGRPLSAAELGRLLGLRGKRPGDTVLDWEAGLPVSGPVALAVWYLLHSGMRPPSYADAIRRIAPNYAEFRRESSEVAQ